MTIFSEVFMSKRLSINTKRILAFTLFCIIFVSSIFLIIRISKKGNGDGVAPDTSPQTKKSKYADAPTVIIDAGHGGEDGGAVGVDGVYEKDLNLAIALELEEMLRTAGISTRLTRDTDILLYDRNSDYMGQKKAQDMAARVAIAEEYEDAVFISIHMNTFTQAKYSGLQVYYSENSPKSAELAETVQTLVAQSLQPNNTRKIKPSGTNIYLLEKITHPAILIECGFISNPEECALLGTAEYRHRLCMTIFSAVVGYFDNNVNTT